MCIPRSFLGFGAGTTATVCGSRWAMIWTQISGGNGYHISKNSISNNHSYGTEVKFCKGTALTCAGELSCWSTEELASVLSAKYWISSMSEGTETASLGTVNFFSKLLQNTSIYMDVIIKHMRVTGIHQWLYNPWLWKLLQNCKAYIHRLRNWN